jgi:hypothetical protein
MAHKKQAEVHETAVIPLEATWLKKFGGEIVVAGNIIASAARNSIHANVRVVEITRSLPPRMAR